MTSREARRFILGVFVGWVMMLLLWAHTAQAKPPKPDPEKLLERSMAIAARCNVLTTECLDRLDLARRQECK
jgi:hypothetical protein